MVKTHVYIGEMSQRLAATPSTWLPTETCDVCMYAVKLFWAGLFSLHQSLAKKRIDYTVRRQFHEKPSTILGCPGVVSIMIRLLLLAGYARFEAVMTFMESLIGTHFIRYVGTNMQHIIKETIYLAGTSADWQGVQLPEGIYEGAQQMLLTLSNIHTLNNIENFANTQSDEVTGNVGDFLAGASVVAVHLDITLAAQDMLLWRGRYTGKTGWSNARKRLLVLCRRRGSHMAPCSLSSLLLIYSAIPYVLSIAFLCKALIINLI